jgi:hypothetical protein
MPIDFSYGTGLAALQNGIGSFVNNWNQSQNQNLALQQQNWKLGRLQDLGAKIGSGDLAGAMQDAAVTGDLSLLPPLITLKQQADQANSFNGTPSGNMSLGGLNPGGAGSSGSTPAPASAGPQVLNTPSGPLDLNAAKSSIASIESVGSGGYAATGPKQGNGDVALGKYQVMASNVPSWTKQALGQSLTPQQFLASPAAQERTFEVMFGNAAQKYGAAGAANWWFTGSPNPNPNVSDSNGTTASDYANRFMSGYVQARGPATQPQNTQVASAPIPSAQGPQQPVRVASANPSMPQPDTLPPPSAQQGGAAKAPQPARGASASKMVPDPNQALDIDDFDGTWTRAQAMQNNGSDNTKPTVAQWDAQAAKGGSDVKMIPAGSAAPQPQGQQPQPAAPAPQAKDNVLAMARSANVPASLMQALQNTQPGSPERLGVLQRAKSFVDNNALLKSQWGSLIDSMVQQSTGTRILSDDQAKALGLPEAVGGVWTIDNTGKPVVADAGKDTTPPGQQNLQDALENWQKYHLPDPNDPANAAWWRNYSATSLGGAKGPLVDMRGQTDAEKNISKSLQDSYNNATQGAIPQLQTLNRMQGSINAGMVAGWGPLENVAENTAAILRKMGYGDTSIENTQEYLANASQDYARLAKATFPQRITNADLFLSQKMSGSSPAQLAAALQNALDVQRENAMNVIKQHNQNVEKYETAFPDSRNIGEYYRIDPNNLPAPVAPNKQGQQGQAPIGVGESTTVNGFTIKRVQ